MNFLLRQTAKQCTHFLTYRPIFGYYVSQHPTEKYISQLNEKQILDTSLVKQIMGKRIPKRTITSQFGLWHGKQPKTGNKTCFSEKKSRRSWAPNIQQRKYYSDVLERFIHTRVSTKAMRCIRKLGGFDNYILLTKPKNLDSIFGEYLRRLMLLKLNKPDFHIPRVAKSRPWKFSRRAQRFSKQPPVVWHPPEIRHKDLTFLNLKSENNMNPRELRLVNQFKQYKEKFEDASETQHPLLNDKFWEDMEEFEEFADREGEKAMQKFMNRKNKEKIRLTLQAVQEDYQEEMKAYGNL